MIYLGYSSKGSYFDPANPVQVFRAPGSHRVLTDDRSALTDCNAQLCPYATLMDDGRYKYNATTSNETTRYYVTCNVDHAYELLDRMSSMLREFHLDLDIISSEAKSIEEEIRMRHVDDVFYDGEEEFAKCKYKCHVRRFSAKDQRSEIRDQTRSRPDLDLI